jgi:hypothetical protein
MKALLIIPAIVIVAGCAKINAAVEVAASADARLRDKCAYLNDGVTIAEAFLGVVPSATNIVRTGAKLATDFCTGRPVTDFASAMAAMERIIVAVRPLATKAAQNR